jgi:hypothetical protein
MKVCSSCESILRNKFNGFQNGPMQMAHRVCNGDIYKETGKTCVYFFALYLLSDDLDLWFGDEDE